MKDGKFVPEDFFSDATPWSAAFREELAAKCNALLEAEREKAPVIEGNMRDGKFWQVMFCPSEHTHTARLVDIREVGE